MVRFGKVFFTCLFIFSLVFSLACFASEDYSIDDRSDFITYTSANRYYCSSAFDGSLSSFSYGNSCSFTFYGSELFIYSSSATNSGRADVYIDGSLVGSTSVLNTTSDYVPGRLVFSKSDLSDSKHTCVLVCNTQYVYNPSLQSVTGRFYLDKVSFAKDPDVSQLPFFSLFTVQFIGLILVSIYIFFRSVYWRLNHD